MDGACIQPVLLLSTPNSGTLAVSINVEVTASDNELKGSGECPKRWLACINRLESRNITCTTHLEVSRIEWVVTAVGSAVSVGEGQSVTLSLSPEHPGLNGAEFTCKIITTQGRTFSETIAVEVKGL